MRQPISENVILLLVLINFLEILVGIDLKLTASSLITGDDSVLVKLKCADGPCVVNAALYAVAECASLAMAADKKENLL